MEAVSKHEEAKPDHAGSARASESTLSQKGDSLEQEVSYNWL